MTNAYATTAKADILGIAMMAERIQGAVAKVSLLTMMR